MERIANALEFGQDWRAMLSKLADSETLVDVYLCANAYGHQNDREKMVAETHGVRIIYVGEDFFIVGPRRPVPASIIPLGWISMISLCEEEKTSIQDLSSEEDVDETFTQNS